MTRKIFTLLFVVAAFMSAQAEIKTIPAATKAPVIDGYIDDVDDGWADFTELTARNPGGTTTGMTAKSCLMYSANFFYWAIKVQDATPSNDATAISNSYERDCAEIFFSMDTVTADAGAYKAGCWQVRLQREGETLVDGNSGANTWSVATLTGSSDFQAATETSATEWSGEIAFPISVLKDGMDPAWDGKFIRFENAVADNTTGAAGGRTEQRYWMDIANGDAGWNNTRVMTIYKIPELGASKYVNSAKASAFVSNNVLNVKNVNGIVNIYDVKGTLVRKSVINGNGSIAISDLKSGVYIVKSNDFAQKFVK